MQTFLPYESFQLSAKVLDRQRLGKQRVECKQILRALYLGGGWANHPAVNMWRGYGWWLLFYYDAICVEWKNRGFQHMMTLDPLLYDRAYQEQTRPPWLGVRMFHLMHRVTLLKKHPEHYLQFFETTDAEQTFIPRLLWPVGKDGQLVNEYSYPQTFRLLLAV